MNLELRSRHIAYIAVTFLSVSFLAYFYNWVNIVAFICFGLLMLVLGLWRREYALYLAFLELILGSFGYLLSFGLNGLNLPLRMLFFVIIMALWAYDLITNYKLQITNFKNSQKIVVALGVFFIVFIAGILQGYWRGHDLSNIFFDANSYLYLLLIFPAISYIYTKEKLDELVKVILAGAAVLAIETLGFFIIFSKSQNLGLLEVIYKWIRDFRIGEITSLKNGAYRIFLQSQIYLLVGFFLIAVLRIYKKINARKYLLLGTLFSAAIYISLSRSLWIGFGAGLAVLVVMLIYEKHGYKKILKIFTEIVAIIFIGTAITTLFIPDASLLESRLKIGESALNTRIEQLRPLIPAIKDNPFFGYGFGKTLTFKSFDPRITYITKDGAYTTYAFEWGYLDMILKVGLLGLTAHLFLIGQIIAVLWHKIKTIPSLASWALMSLAALLAVHFFTPYLNHPLGIGIIILATTIANIDKNEKMS